MIDYLVCQFLGVSSFNVMLKARFISLFTFVAEKISFHHATSSAFSIAFFAAFSAASSFACWKKGVASITLTSL